MPKFMGGFFGDVQAYFTEAFGWLYIVSMTGFLVVALGLLFSRAGSIRLGGREAKPEFSRLTWFAMLFSAGMGIGLLFYGIAEPVMHYTAPASPAVRGGTFNAARNAMGITIFHWGLHPWACYALIGLALAYFSFNRGRSLTIRSAFYPLFGNRVDGSLGHIIDTLAVVSTLFGVATSLGLGAMQINAGLDKVFGIPKDVLSQTLIIIFITGLATISVVTGLKRGIKILSLANMSIAALLMIFVFSAGPTLFLLNAMVENVGIYLQTLPVNSFWTSAYEEERRQWLGDWTVFYWAWWIAWSPFVGLFIARISRGRTIREFLLAVLLAPTLMSIMWFTVMGNSALYGEMFGDGGLAAVVSEDLSISLFVFLERFPFSTLTSILAVVCVGLFFVTSSDSASLVIDTIASGGKLEPPVWQRVFWASVEGIVAIILLLAGGLKALQTAAITTALPFLIVLFIMIAGLLKSLAEDKDRL